jgi:tetratricopeptide (TPR) repeat protein
LTDHDGQYVEVQSGRLFNQSLPAGMYTPFKYRSFAPSETDQWTEYWFPVLQTKGLVKANESGALNVRNENGWLKINFSPVQNVNDELAVHTMSGNTHKHLTLKPLEPFADSIRIGANDTIWHVSIGSIISYGSMTNKEIELSRPIESPRDFDWNSIYGLYLAGKSFMDERMYHEAEEKIRACLKSDRNYCPALVALSELEYRKLNYNAAFDAASKAIAINSYDPAANYYYGLSAFMLGRSFDAKDGLDIASQSAEYRVAAFTRLGGIYFKEKNYARAEAYSKKALDYNRSNMDAMHLLAVLYRKQNDTPAYFETLRTIVTTDPLDHFAKFEQYYRGEAGITDSAFLSTIQNELPSETCIDLAAWYYRIGCLDEVKSLLRITPAGIEADAWKRYFSVPLTQRDTRHSIGAFPFREETAQLLMELMGRDKDWRLKYWLGLIYQSRSSNEKAKTLFIDCGDEPGDPDFYAARAALIPAHAETDLLRAISIDREQWRFYRYLVQYYLERGQNEKALSLAEDYYRQHQGNYMMGMLYAKTLLLNERFTDCDQVLSKLDIIPFEGATEGRQLYREAKLMEAIGAMKKKDYKEAQQYIGEARLWPENLGEGKPYEADIDERLEDWMDYQCCLQRKKTGEAARSLQKIIQFNLKTDNVLSTAYPANHLVTAWAMEKTGQAKKAIQWLDEKLKTDPANKILIWVKAVFDKKQMVPAPVNDATVRILQRLLEKAN